MDNKEKIIGLLQTNDRSNWELGIGLANSQGIDLTDFFDPIRKVHEAEYGSTDVYDLLTRYHSSYHHFMPDTLDAFCEESYKPSIYLKNINIELSRLSNIPAKVLALSQLESLSISFNSINILPKELANFSKLLYFSGDDIDLKSIPNFFYNLKQLKEVSLRNNSINHISNDISKLVNLEWLVISGNPIKELPEAIFTLKKLSNLIVYNMEWDKRYYQYLEKNLPNTKIHYRK